MVKGQKTEKKSDTPKWFKQPASITMKRMLEDALVDLYIDKDLDPESGRQKTLSFVDLLPYLSKLDKKWSVITPSMLDFRNDICMKQLYNQFSHLRQQPKKLVPLIETRLQEISRSESNGINGDYGEEELEGEDQIKDE
jgi:HD superfamily phosphohydrolase